MPCRALSIIGRKEGNGTGRGMAWHGTTDSFLTDMHAQVISMSWYCSLGTVVGVIFGGRGVIFVVVLVASYA